MGSTICIENRHNNSEYADTDDLWKRNLITIMMLLLNFYIKIVL